MQLQQAHLQKRIKVWEAVAPLGVALPEAGRDGDRLLEQLGLADKRNAWFMTLSGGQQQRLFIALALINDPEVVFLDELTTGLDPQARRAIWELVRGIRARGKTVFMTTHLMEEAERLCDRVAIIEHGRIIDVDTPAAAGRPALPGTHRRAGDRPAAGRGALSRAAAGGRGEARRVAVHPSRPWRRLRDRRDPVPGRTPDPGQRLPHRTAHARGRVPQADRPLDSGLRTMLRGLLQLTWLEIKIFLREPLGAIGTLVMPVAMFVLVGRAMGRRTGAPRGGAAMFLQTGLPVLVSILIAISAVLSLVTIISIYREGRHPQAAARHAAAAAHDPDGARAGEAAVHGDHAGPAGAGRPALLSGRRRACRSSRFALAVLVSTLAILSMGFVIASLVPTARFAQPIGAVVFYPMLAVSGLFAPVEALPPALQAARRGCCR